MKRRQFLQQLAFGTAGAGLGFRMPLVHAMDYTSMLHRYRRDVAALEEQAQEMERIAADFQLVEHISKAQMFLAWARAKRGEVKTCATQRTTTPCVSGSPARNRCGSLSRG